MAIQKDTEFIGTIEHLIYYNWLGIYCIRMLPKRVLQTIATKKAASNFGLASSRSKIIRDLLKPLIAQPRDKAKQVLLKRALFKTLKTVETAPLDIENNPLKGFRFNESLPIEEILGVALEIEEYADQKVRVMIPAMNSRDSIVVPTGTSRVELTFLTISISFNHEHSFLSPPETLNIPMTDVIQPPVIVELEAKGQQPCIVLVITALSYWDGDRQVNPEGSRPLEIVAAFEERGAGIS